MKTAISIPDEVFQEAEKLARRQRQSRSRLYRDALIEYIARRAPNEITAAMNNACAAASEPKHSFVAVAAVRTLRRVEW